MAAHSAPPGNLHTVRRWLSLAFDLTEIDASITSQALRGAIETDLEWYFSKLIYRGRSLTQERFHRWIGQFPGPHPSTAMHLVKRIAEEYYIGDSSYYEYINDLITGSGIRKGTRVVFCKWQYMGASAPAVAHDLKTQANWKVMGEIDLDQPRASWPAFSGADPEWFVLADDFVGSGGTLAKLFSNKHGGISELLKKYSAAKVLILTVAGFESGLRAARQAIRVTERTRVVLLAARLFQDEDTCFHPQSRILAVPEQRTNSEPFV